MASLRDGMTPGEDTASLVMSSRPRQVSVLVEGRSDKTAYARYFSLPPAKFLDVYRGRDYVLEKAQELRGADRTFIGIIDADEDCPLGRRRHPDGVFSTDLRDLETTMFFGGAGEAVISQLLDPVRADAFARSKGVPLIEWVAGQCAFTGALRLAAVALGETWRFRDVNLGDHVDPKRMRVDHGTYLAALRDASGTRMGYRQLKRAAESTLEQYSGRLLTLVHGHDLMAFLAALTRGPNTAGPVHTANSVELAVRSAFTQDDFEHTDLWRHLSDWEAHLGTPFLRRAS